MRGLKDRVPAHARRYAATPAQPRTPVCVHEWEHARQNGRVVRGIAAHNRR